MASITLEPGRQDLSRTARWPCAIVSLEIADGELLVLVGPSGCGKSTVLRLIAGLETPTAGRILIDGRDVTGVPPQRRDLAMVFQSYALYPHKTRAREPGVRAADARASTRRASPRASPEPPPRSASSRCSIASRRSCRAASGSASRSGRAIVREPQAFLLDEPLSNLDPLLRVETRAELALLHRRLARDDGLRDARSGRGDDARHVASPSCATARSNRWRRRWRCFDSPATCSSPASSARRR